MPIAIGIAFAAHAALIAAIGVSWPEPKTQPRTPLEVMIVTQAGTSTPADVDAAVAAQIERPGQTQTMLPELDDAAVSSADPLEERTSGEASSAPAQTDTAPPRVAAPAPGAEEFAARQPQTALEEPGPVPVITDAGSPPSPTATPELDAADEPDPDLAKRPAPPETARILSPQTEEPDAPRAVSAADIFASRNAEMLDLAARIQEQSTAYAARTRRKAISTATREYIYANYMEGWRRKVERIGNLNYPSEARELGLFGSLILHVAVRSDGTIEGIRVVRSSGHDVLDQAAVRIVELAAPFAPFPPNVKREIDVLDITRTWQFQRNNQLGWDN